MGGGEGKKDGRQCSWQRARRVSEGGKEGKLLQGVMGEDSKRLAYGEVLK